MPLYSFWCEQNHETEMFVDMAYRDSVSPLCDICQEPTKRGPGGHGLLWFEEGRGRVHSAFGDKPITSHAEHERLKRQHGLVDAGNNLPTNIGKREPKSEAMRRFRDKGQKGKWV